MSDTVLVALITFASGAIGSIIGYFTARHSAKMALRKDAQRAIYDRRVVAFSDFSAAFIKAAETNRSGEAMAQIANALILARLVATPETDAAISAVVSYLSSSQAVDMDVLSELERDMISAMHSDLDEYASEARLSRVFRNICGKHRKPKFERSSKQKRDN